MYFFNVSNITRSGEVKLYKFRYCTNVIEEIEGINVKTCFRTTVDSEKAPIQAILIFSFLHVFVPDYNMLVGGRSEK